MTLELIFWVIVGFVIYTYAGYPILLGLFGRLQKRAPYPEQAKLPGVSLILAVYNEEQTIGRRLHELTGLIAASGVEAEVIVVSDGSTDGTPAIVRSFAKVGVRLIEMPTNSGKAAALTIGCQAASNEVLMFADARQVWATDAMIQLLKPFADPQIGAVSGDLAIESSPGIMAGVGMYWRYEKCLRRARATCIPQLV